MVKAIYVWWDSGLSRRYADVLIESLFHVLEVGEDFRNSCTVKVLGNFDVGDGEFENSDWYFRTNYDPGRKQVWPNGVIQACLREPWQKKQPHLEVIGTSYDLGYSDLNFVFGSSWPAFASIISNYRMRKFYGEENGLIAFKQLCLHEIGHLFGAPSNLRKRNFEYNLGPHCTLEDCAMGQVNVKGRPDALQAALRTLNRYLRSGSYFCEDCVRDIVVGKRGLIS